MRNYLDQAGGLWAQHKLVGKVGSVFCSTGTQHGGQETTITSFHTTLLHLGMIIVGTPYSQPGLTNMNEISVWRYHSRWRRRAQSSGERE
jgi:NAD(P)H dehydrogenase (quinone)